MSSIIRRGIVAMMATVLVVAVANGAVYYVTQNGNDGNDGLTWGTALLTIQAAVDKASSDDAVWVAEGTYVGNVNYNYKWGLKLYGGFVGTETSVLERDLDVHQTIITQGVPGDTAVQIAWLEGGRFDGFVVADNVAARNPGLLLDGNMRDVQVINCKFLRNYTDTTGDAGGAVLVMSTATGGATISNCVFDSNVSDFGYGSAIGFGWQASAVVQDCTFTNNSALRGGAIGFVNNRGGTPIAFAEIADCVFDSNLATSSRGGAVGGGYLSAANFRGCLFVRNRAISGGAVALENTTNNNISTEAFTFTDCAFEENVADGDDGGGVHMNFASRISLARCAFSANTASDVGGGMFVQTQCRADSDRCWFEDNVANSGGAAFFNYQTNGSFTNCVVVGNIGRNNAGGVILQSGYQLDFMNCTLAYNQGAWNNAIGISGAGTVNATNTISAFNQGTNFWTWANSPGETTFNLTNVIIFGNGNNDIANSGAGDPPAQGNINQVAVTKADPMFINGPLGDLHLAYTLSPGVNGGLATGAPTVDYEGTQRPVGSAVDIGAFEARNFRVLLGDWAGPLSNGDLSTLQVNLKVNGTPYGLRPVAVDGTFSLPAGLPTGTVSMQTQVRSSVSRTMSVSLPTGSAVFNLPNGDTNGSNEVDDADITNVILDYASAGGVNGITDLNGDGTVDDADLTIAILYFGEAGN